jgi:pimeloyl-ACP methyl ester carboxylesterase
MNSTKGGMMLSLDERFRFQRQSVAWGSIGDGFPWSAQAWRNIAPWIGETYTRHIAEVQKRFKKPDFKVHLIWGQHDTFIPLEQGRELQGLLDADSLDES